MLRALIDNMPDFMYVKDIHSRFIVANAHVAQRRQDSPEKLLGKTDFDFFPPEIAQAYFEDEQARDALGRGPLTTRRRRAWTRTGNEVDILTTKVPVRDHPGTCDRDCGHRA